jgi:2-polyprenyl-3-methyl-5-hydroxy-6-metoxy-1,4-benzoquinol methylase
MHNTKEWHNFFSDFNVFTNSIRLKPFIDDIVSVANREKPILELGSGSGATARILADMGYTVIATDIDNEVVKGLQANSCNQEDRLRVEWLDMLDIKYKANSIGVIIHQGLLEHFSNKMILKTLSEQARTADWVVFDVPNDRDNEQHYGDERFLSYSQWKELIEEAGLTIVKCTGRMVPRWTYFFPHAFFTNKPGIWSWLGRRFGKAYIFTCKSQS